MEVETEVKDSVYAVRNAGGGGDEDRGKGRHV